MANMLSNALKFTFQGSITVRIYPVQEKSFCFEVEDTGIGIKEEDQSKLFRSFGKVDLEEKNYMNSQGVGLGLVISNALAKMLGPVFTPEGIKVASEYGKGSKFSFVIENRAPMKLEETNTIIPTEGEKTIDIPYFIFSEQADSLGCMTEKCGCPQILIADDDAFNLLALENILEHLGYKVDSCYNGEQVLSNMQKRLNNPCTTHCVPYKLIFLDCNMPIMDGYTCAGHLKTLFSDNSDCRCPIIACTAGVESSEKQKAIDSGMDDYCSKPINKTKIQELVEMHYSKGKPVFNRVESLLSTEAHL
jgi:CheY-like chemotaxis protein